MSQCLAAALLVLVAVSGAAAYDTGVDNVLAYGAVGDGAADDTVAVQAALDGLRPGRTLLFPPGTYRAAGLLLPAVADVTLRGVGGGGGLGGGKPGANRTSTLLLAPGRTARFLLASAGWAANDTWTGPPVSLVGLTFDGGAVTDRSGNATAARPPGVVLMSWSVRVARCVFRRFGAAGLLVTAANAAGESITTTQVNSRYEANVFNDNAGDGFRIADPRRNRNTDYFLRDNFAFGNGGSGFRLETTAGALISGNHLYGNAAWDVDASIGSMALRVADNYLEGARSLRLATLNPGVGVVFRGNYVEGQVAVAAADGNATFVSSGNSFRAGAFMQLAGRRGGVLTVTSVGDRFGGPQPWYRRDGEVAVLTAALVPLP
jgi:hypothetical protein